MSPGCLGWEGTLGTLVGHCQPRCGAGRREVGVICRHLASQLGTAAGRWSPARPCLEAGVLLPATDLRDRPLLPLGKGGPQGAAPAPNQPQHLCGGTNCGVRMLMGVASKGVTLWVGRWHLMAVGGIQKGDTSKGVAPPQGWHLGQIASNGSGIQCLGVTSKGGNNSKGDGIQGRSCPMEAASDGCWWHPERVAPPEGAAPPKGVASGADVIPWRWHLMAEDVIQRG